MAGTEGNATEINVLKTLVNTLAQSVQTLAERQAAPTEQLTKTVELTSSLEYQQRCFKREHAAPADPRHRAPAEPAG